MQETLLLPFEAPNAACSGPGKQEELNMSDKGKLAESSGEPGSVSGPLPLLVRRVVLLGRVRWF